ncbi:MAG: FtsH protease activity modulator HflK [Eubacteriales bacterium]|nr:FtsH protease activity modulator HflK [Eubacteriales bacterium]
MNQNPFGNNPFGGNQNPFNGQNPFEDILNKIREQEQKNAQNRQNQNSGQKPEQGPEKFDSSGRPVRKRPSFKGLGVALAAAVLVFAGMNCYYVLDEENYAVVTTLGNPQAETQAGLHFKIPFIQNVRLVSKGIKGLPIGYIPETGEAIEEESIMITKDFNFVETDFYLEYMVSDPVKYLYASVEPEATLKMLAQSYIRDTVGVYNVDDVITTGKAVIQSEIKEKLTNRMIEEDIGLSVVNITIQDAFPPTTEVMNAFKNVENAKQGKETAINNANKDRNEKIPQAEAECDQIIKNAEAQKQARINEAQGQVSRFEQMYAEYSKYPLITKQRMFYETMEDVLPNMKVYLVDESGTQKMLPLDSFTASMQSGGATGGAAGSGNGGAAGSGAAGNATGGSNGNAAGGTGQNNNTAQTSPSAGN